jgi:Putative zinc-finger
MRCEEVREMLPEHLLGVLDEEQGAAVSSHLRGCAGCRGEASRLEDGVVAFSLATHDRPPPSELRSDVLDVLRDEWSAPDERRAAAATPIRPPRVRNPWVGVAAAAASIALVVGVWGAVQAQRAQSNANDASSYQSLLATLGGKEFRVGKLVPAEISDVGGSVVLYRGELAKGWSSWGIVFVRVPDFHGTAKAILTSPDGASLKFPEVDFEDGEGVSWLVTDNELEHFDRLTVTSSDGTVLATAQINEA